MEENVFFYNGEDKLNLIISKTTMNSLDIEPFKKYAAYFSSHLVFAS